MPPGFEQTGIDVVLSQLEPTWGDCVQNMRRHLPVANARNVLHRLQLRLKQLAAVGKGFDQQLLGLRHPVC